MPAPTNLTAATATILGSLPASVTQDVHNAGTTYTVWYGPIEVATNTTIRAHPFGDLSVYLPRVDVFTGPASSPVNLGINSNANSPVQFRATTAQSYYLRIRTNTGNPTPAILQLAVSAHVAVSVPAGSIVVPDDEFRYASILSPTVDHGVLAFIDLSPGEAGDVLATGDMLVEDIIDSGLDVYQPDFTLLTEIPFNTSTVGGSIRANWAQNLFVAGNPGNPNIVKIVQADGTIVSTHTLTGEPANLRACAISNDGSTLYWGRQTSGGDDTGIVYRWDLNNDVALSDLVNHGDPAHVWEIIVLSDNSILVLFVAASGPTPVLVEVLRYDATGTLLDTYDFTSEPDQWFPADAPPRIARALDDPLSFWIRLHYDTGYTRFRNVRISDGATISEVEYLDYLGGKYIAEETATPVADWGVSISCPFWIMPVALGAIGAGGDVGIIGPLVWVHMTRRI